MASWRAGAAARTAAQKRLLEQLQAAKESLRPGDGTSASIPPKEADVNAQTNGQNITVTGFHGL